LVPTRKGTVQGYNAQAVVTEHQVVVAAALAQQANDLQQLGPMLAAVDQTLAAADLDQRPGRVLADAGYWSIANLTSIPDAPDLYIPPARHGRQGKPRKDGSRRRPRAMACAPPWSPARKRPGQGLLRHAQADRGAGLRAAQGAAGRPPV
jgi:hypothetical protein